MIIKQLRSIVIDHYVDAYERLLPACAKVSGSETSRKLMLSLLMS
jgi:hypothetical protein